MFLPLRALPPVIAVCGAFSLHTASAQTAAAPSAGSSSAAAAGEVSITADAKAVEVRFQNRSALKYILTKPADSRSISPSACYFHPLTTPSGVVLTDVGPDDHLHHRGVFCAWLELRDKSGNAGDFWGWGQYAPLENRLIRNAGLEAVGASADEARGTATATFTAKNDWLNGDKALLRENLKASAVFRKDCQLLDLDWTFQAPADCTLPRHAFSGFVVRTRKDAAISAADPAGPVKLPAPSHLKPESDWPAKPWYALELALKDGAKAGVAVINHPDNPPTAWHIVTGIGLLNPCITAPGPVEIKAEKPLRLRYRVVTFDGAASVDLLNQLSTEFAK